MIIEPEPKKKCLGYRYCEQCPRYAEGCDGTIKEDKELSKLDVIRFMAGL